MNSVIAVLPVKDFSTATAWYATWLGRPADVEPMDGIAEWQIAENAWIQVTVDPDTAGRTNVVVGVDDLDAQIDLCTSAGVDIGAVEEYPDVVKTLVIADPDGNKVTFAQDLTEG
ncbi:VOC family protein [Rhodococcus sp. ABRD24]|nr:VOC family protein [Rhodococcus sp. ABRD24]